MRLSVISRPTFTALLVCLALSAPAMAATVSFGELTAPVTLHGTAREATEPGSDQSALVLDGAAGSYAGVAVPDSWKPVSFRVQVRFRLDERR
ncbi:hypothetical protein LLH03_09940, partial [bacterium]|nr:hypothetical protein [bacterium]